MRWAYPLGRAFGIRLEIHATFLLILLWIGWLGWQAGGWLTALWALLLVVLLFVCVILHELGHSVVAMRFGVQVRYIVLFPIGGVAAMSEIPEKPIQEFLIAIAGPLVNVAIVLLLWGITGSLWPDPEMSLYPTNVGGLLDRLLLANVVLVVFNMLPAFPMDGGRIMRSLLALVLPYHWATQIAVICGQVLALGFVVLGIQVRNPFLVVIAVFVFLGAMSENRMVRMRARFRGIRALDVMSYPGEILDPSQPLSDCMRFHAEKNQSEFLVMSGDRLVGILDREHWVRHLQADGPEKPVGDVMQRGFVCFQPLTEMSHVWQDMMAMQQRIFPIVENHRVLGKIAYDDVTRFLVRAQGPSDPLRGRYVGPSAPQPAPYTIDLG